MKILSYFLFFFLFAFTLQAQEHPNLILTKQGVVDIQANLGQLPKLDVSFELAVEVVEAEMAKGIDVPMPKDLAGGYTHATHKRNFFTLQKAGVLFQITGDEKYAVYVRDMFLMYAELFPQFERHPATRSYAPGKFFWQCLNDANWLVYSSQAYDCIYDWLDKKTRKKLNKELFRPMADFLSVETPQFFNRIHNHSTWGNAAVGMIGLVMDDEELINRALNGLDQVVPADQVKDNDGGLIQLPGQKEAGFFAQIDHSFSPDGYYTEGPYYQRYAMYPFLIFAQALANEKSELNIFEYRDGVLIKGVYALVDQTNAAGEFFPINDAVKGMSILSRELVTALSLAYRFGGQDPDLLGFIDLQTRVPLNDAGLQAAEGLLTYEAQPLVRRSLQLTDGQNGDEGALGIIRNADDDNEVCLVMKYTKHGMGHGHFDKLSFLYYHNEKEVFQDYGSARWVNIEQKDGGGYLKENKTWAKQTIAHNTVTVNQTTQYNGNVKVADQHHSDPYVFNTADAHIQVMSAVENNAVEDVDMHRTMVMIKDESLEYPIVLDLFRLDTDKSNTYDYPFYFQGHVMTANFAYTSENVLEPMGTSNGYQHLWKEATGTGREGMSQLEWFNGETFFTLSTVTDTLDNLVFGRIGATDPEYNLRRDPVFMVRRTNTRSTMFVSTYEVHGHYSPVTEIAVNSYSQVTNLEILKNNKNYSIVQVTFKNGNEWQFAIANNNPDAAKKHEMEVDGKQLAWTGPYQLFKNTK